MHLLALGILSPEAADDDIMDQIERLTQRPDRFLTAELYKAYLSEEELRLRWLESLPHQTDALDALHLDGPLDESLMAALKSDAYGYYAWRNEPLPRQWATWEIGGSWDGIVRGKPVSSDGICRCANWGIHLEQNICLVSGLPVEFAPSLVLTPDGQWHWIPPNPQKQQMQLLPLSTAAFLRPYQNALAVVIDCQFSDPRKRVVGSCGGTPESIWTGPTENTDGLITGLFPADLSLLATPQAHLYAWAYACNWRVRRRRQGRDPATAEEWLDEWLVCLQRHQNLRIVRQAYCSLHHLLSWVQQHLVQPLILTHLTPTMLTAYQSYLERMYPPNTANWRIQAVRAWCTWLASRQLVDPNLDIQLEKTPRSVHTVPYGFTSAQVERLLQAAAYTLFPERDQALLLMILESGMRMHECAWLTWQDITFRQTGGSLLIGNGWPTGSRWVSLSPIVCQALLQYAATLLKAEPTLDALRAAWPAGKIYEPLWKSRRGRPLSQWHLTRILADLAQNAGGFAAPLSTDRRLRETCFKRALTNSPEERMKLAIQLGIPLQLLRRFSDHQRPPDLFEDLWQTGVF